MSKTFAMTLDLKDAPELIAAYEEHHRHVPQAIVNHLTAAGIESMKIYRWSNRLFMTLVTSDQFSFVRMKQLDEANPDVQAWEKLMWNFQQALPGAKPGEKWLIMNPIFEL